MDLDKIIGKIYNRLLAIAIVFLHIVVWGQIYDNNILGIANIVTIDSSNTFLARGALMSIPGVAIEGGIIVFSLISYALVFQPLIKRIKDYYLRKRENKDLSIPTAKSVSKTKLRKKVYV